MQLAWARVSSHLGGGTIVCGRQRGRRGLHLLVRILVHWCCLRRLGDGRAQDGSWLSFQGLPPLGIVARVWRVWFCAVRPWALGNSCGGGLPMLLGASIGKVVMIDTRLEDGNMVQATAMTKDMLHDPMVHTDASDVVEEAVEDASLDLENSETAADRLASEDVPVG
ncbi:hypothetical protein V6N11_031143 [Hibiscus sabdariffa]|uniref:Uncharacterized protein n=1 Tax=Hibiscus sabdariffa TaxID=183260 RepID=A0ABR2N9W1_9ROSI